MPEETNAPLKITINGQEYDESEASELIDKGRATKEAEAKYNTPLDKVWPEYGKSREELKTEREARTNAEKQLEDFRKKQDEGKETPKDVKDAKEAAKALGLTFHEDLDNAGFIKKSDLDSYLDDRDKKRNEEQQSINAVLNQANELETKIDGADGRPKFNKKVVLAYARTYGFDSLEKAYEDMNKDTLDSWKQEQINKAKSKSLKTLNGGGDKSPNEPKVNDSNFRESLKESLWGGKNEES